ncbi:MAG: dihydroneopterin triphosphate diphosphatase [Pseudomonadota bacterium]
MPRRPESVLVLVYNRDGQVLLLRRSKPFDFWQSITGSLDPDETHAAAAARELAEETGLCDPARLHYSGVSRQFTIDPRWQDRYDRGVRENVEYEWHYLLDAACEVRLAADEHSEYQWLPVAEAIDTVWSWTNRDALRTLATRLTIGLRTGQTTCSATSAT